jgi:hypothetical protein
MSYYILPKNINIVNVNPETTDNETLPFISFSLLNYYNILNNEIVNNNYYDLIKIVNSYEFVYSNVTGLKYSISKLKNNTNLFYDLIEIMYNLNIIDDFKYKNISILNISNNDSDCLDCINIFRENYKDNNIYFKNFDVDIKLENKFNLIFFLSDYDSKEYSLSILKVLLIILNNQSYGGNIIIKLKDIFYKPIIDFFYIISSLYEKVYITKPNTNNITTFEKYIVCKNFIIDENNNYLKSNYQKILNFIKNLNGKYIKQITNDDIPYYFKTKISDFNTIIGQQQLEALNLIISIYKSKNKEEKIEIIKKSNIQKSILWCEKYKIPNNKINEKNIFLPIINEKL